MFDVAFISMGSLMFIDRKAMEFLLEVGDVIFIKDSLYSVIKTKVNSNNNVINGVDCTVLKIGAT